MTSQDPTSKQLKELEQLQLAYSSKDYSSLIHHDKPDFILTKDSRQFGVEVTEYFQHPSSARYNKIPGYMDHILETGKPYVKDKGMIERVNMQYQDSKGNWIAAGQAVYREILSPAIRIQVLQQDVEKKNVQYIDYDQMERIDLLIVDSKAELTAGIQRAEILKYLRDQERANTIVSPYANITLVIKETGRAPIIIRLKHNK